MLRKIFIALLVLALFTGTAFAQVTAGLPQTMDLKAGFNFVSFSVKPLIQAADFKNQNPAIQELYSFSAASGSFLSVSEGTLINLTAGRGYIVKAASPVIISVTGEPIQTVGTLNLKAGFNLIGISKPVTAMKFSDLMKAYPVIRGLYRYSAASGSFIQVLKNATGLAELLDGIDPTFTIGQAYFMYVDSDTAMNYDNGAITMTGGTPAANVPAVTGLAYDQTGNKLKWNPITATTTGAMYQYIVKIDGMTYPVAPGMMDFSIPATVMAGPHSAQIQAMMQGSATTMSQYGPWSPEPALMFTTAGGGSNTLAVTGLTYVATGNKLKWNPIIVAGTTAGTTAANTIAYNVKIDGQMVNTAALTMNEYLLPATMTGSHIAQVQAMITGSDQLPGPWSPEPALNFTVGGGTSNLAVTGLMYDVTGNKLKWNPIIVAGATTASAIMYNINIDGKMANTAAISMNEYILPAGMTGSHNAQVQAVLPAVGTTTAQMGPWSPEPALNFTIGGGTNPLGITGLMYDVTGNKLKWNPIVIAGATAANTVTYNVKIDGQMVNTAAISMNEYILPAAMTGSHIAQVQAIMPASGTTTTAQMGPWSPEPALNFMIGGGTNPLGITGLMYDVTGKKLKWNPIVIAGSTTANAIMYNVKIDGQQAGNALTTTEYILPATMTGAHVAQVQAIIPATATMPTAQMGPWSPEPPFNFMIGGGTNPLGITGLTYVATGNKLKWNPIIVAGATAATAVMYNVNIDGQQVGNALTMSEYLLPATMTGSHNAQVQAIIPPSATAPAAQMGPWSPEPPFNFMIGGGTNPLGITGLIYDAAGNKLKWNPVIMAGTTTANAVMYNVEIDGQQAGNALTTSEFFLPAGMTGSHVAQVQAIVPATAAKPTAQMGPWSPEPPFNFMIGGGTNTLGITGLIYDATGNKLKWNPVVMAGTTTANSIMYNVKFDGQQVGNALLTTEFLLPVGMTGSHNAQVQAIIPPTATSPNAQMGPWSPEPPFNFMIGGGTNPLNITGLVYDLTGNKLKWNPVVVAGTTTANAAMYNVKIDGQQVGNALLTSEFLLPTGMTGSHIANVQAFVPASATMPTAQMGPMSTVNFTVGSATAAALVFAPVPMAGTTFTAPLNVTITWPNTPAGGTIFYTLDNSDPLTANNANVKTYAMAGIPLMVNGTYTIKAVGKSPTAQTPVVAQTYILGPPATGVPAITPPFNYQSATNKVTWMPVNYNGLAMKYRVKFDGIEQTTLLTAAEFMVPANTTAGNHTLHVRAEAPATAGGAAQVGPWSPIDPFIFTVGGAGASGLVFAPVPMAGTNLYAPLNVTITWPNAPAGAMIYYTLDGSDPNGANALTYAFAGIPLAVNGTYNIKAIGKSPTVQSTVASQTYVLGASSGTLPAVTGLMYDPTGNKLKWNAVAPPATGGTVSYMVAIDTQTPVPVYTPEYMLPTTMTGTHKATVFARIMSTTGIPQDGTPAMLDFTVGGTTANLSVTFAPAGGSYPNAALSVMITPAPADAKIYYTVDGTMPVPNGTIMTGGPVTVSVPANSANFKITAVAHLNGATGTSVSQIYNTTGTGTTTGTIPAVTGLMYDAAMNKLKWNPITMPAGAYTYDLKVDGVSYPAGNMTEFMLPAAVMTGSHIAQVQAKLPAVPPATTFQMGPWAPEPAYTFTTGTTTGTIPAVTGLMYDTAMNKLKWNPITMPTGAYTYDLKIDGVPYPAGNMTEFMLPAAVMAGAHTAQVQAKLPAVPPATTFQMGPWSPEPAYTFTSTTGTTPTAPAQPTIVSTDMSTPGTALAHITITAAAGAQIKYSISSTTNGDVPGTPAAPSTMTAVNSPVTIDLPVGTKMYVAAVAVLNNVYSTPYTSFFNNYQTTTATTFTVPGAVNGSINVNINPAPMTTMPTIGDFTVTYSLNGGADMPAGAVTMINGAMAQPNFTLSVPVIPAGTVAQNAVYKVTYKGITASSPQFSVPVGTTPPAGTAPAAPTFTPAGGSLVGGTMIQINCPTPGAMIKYTIDGTDPAAIPGTATTVAAPASVSSPIVGMTITIKAIAVKDGMNSALMQQTYTGM